MRAHFINHSLRPPYPLRALPAHRAMPRRNLPKTDTELHSALAALQHELLPQPHPSPYHCASRWLEKS